MNIKVDILLNNLLLLSLIIYFSQGLFYPTGSIISIGSLLIYFLVSFYYMGLFVHYNEENRFGKLLLVFLIIIYLYWFFSERQILQFRSIDNFKNYIFFIVTFYPFYFFSQDKVLTEKSLKTFLILIFIIFTLQFYSLAEVMMNERGRINNVNNASYYFVSLLPLMGLFLKNKVVYFSLYSIALYMVIASAKRGAIILFVIGGILAFYFLLKDTEKHKRLLNIIFFLIGMTVVVYFSYEQFINNDFTRSRFDLALEGSSSGREVIYLGIFSKWLNSINPFNIIFGYGFNGSVKLVSNYAHNDWLEVMAGQGLLGILFYFSIFYSAWQYYSENKNYMYEHEKFIILTVLLMWFFQSLFSMVFTGLFTFTYVLCLAFIMGNTMRRKLDFPTY